MSQPLDDEPTPDAPCVFCPSTVRLSGWPARWRHVQEELSDLGPRGHYPTPYPTKYSKLCVCGRRKTHGFELCGLCWWRMKRGLPQSFVPRAPSPERQEAMEEARAAEVADSGVHRGQHPRECFDCHGRVDEPDLDL